MNIQQQYKTNITWSCVETIFFQSILLIHQYMLFKVTEPYFYGLMGTLFGCIYFMVKLCDLGLSKILMSFFLDYSQNQQAVYSFLKSQVIPTILLYCMVAVIFLCAHHVFIPKSIVSINNQLIIILLTIIAIEIIKAITKKLLQLSLHFRHIALCEIALIVWYPVIIWLYYYAYNTLPILFIFSSFAVLSAIETMCLIYFFLWP